MDEKETDASAERAAHGVMLYVAILEAREGVSIEERTKYRGEHFRFIDDLDKRGIIFASGPVIDEATGKSDGGSVCIVRAKSLAEAEAIVRQEPFVVHGIKSVTVRPWRFVTGEAIELARAGQ